MAFKSQLGLELVFFFKSFQGYFAFIPTPVSLGFEFRKLLVADVALRDVAFWDVAFWDVAFVISVK